MNRFILPVLIIVAVVAVGSAGFLTYSHFSTGSTSEEIPPVFTHLAQIGVVGAPPVIVILDTPLPKVPETLMAYRIVTPNVDDEYAAEIAKTLRFDGDLIPLRGFPGEKREVYTYVKGAQRLEISMDGNILLVLEEIPSKVLQIPSEQECISLAAKWLEEHNAYPENIYSVDTRPYLTRDGKPLVIVVNFKTMVGDYGSSNGLSLVVGDGGEVYRVFISLPRSVPYAKVRLKSPEQALDVLRRYLADPNPIPPGQNECILSMRAFTTLTIKQVTLEYFPGGGYLQPTYVFKGDAYDEKVPGATEMFIARVDGVDRGE
ncbi:MAG: hypothetical protein COS88_05430 [Chloroflexi bacterium CG07_land_8_20_14_0_80_51_10]|nr:MAG: hypothetical protein COS88_05430 [Chloroflexi bacterium CG07_land_8_20_14_0_80_51_10]